MERHGTGKDLRVAAVAATRIWTDPDGVRMPAGAVHAWERGTNQTLCGIQLGRAGLVRFAHVAWPDVQPATGRHADEVREVCRRCAAATGTRRDTRPWRRKDPRP